MLYRYEGGTWRHPVPIWRSELQPCESEVHAQYTVSPHEPWHGIVEPQPPCRRLAHPALEKRWPSRLNEQKLWPSPMRQAPSPSPQRCELSSHCVSTPVSRTPMLVQEMLYVATPPAWRARHCPRSSRLMLNKFVGSAFTSASMLVKRIAPLFWVANPYDCAGAELESLVPACMNHCVCGPMKRRQSIELHTRPFEVPPIRVRS
mmetsp:Transcript_29079/g.76175  ORF Transcript_29079/g.76175 Transcript_29079/m.76175 type:complete len:204 (-) Transcript_29079:678-1289(-)